MRADRNVGKGFLVIETIDVGSQMSVHRYDPCPGVKKNCRLVLRRKLSKPKTGPLRIQNLSTGIRQSSSLVS